VTAHEPLGSELAAVSGEAGLTLSELVVPVEDEAAGSEGMPPSGRSQS
jgi:hypothetical protein